MKKILFILVSFITFSTLSQAKLKTYSKKLNNGFEFLADNDEHCPVSVMVHLSLNNMSSSNGNHKVFVIPAKTKGYLITKLAMIKNGRYGYNVKTRFNHGNHFNEIEDKDYKYSLPYKKGKSFIITQGYNNATGTHKNENSLDFGMPINTDIYAVRAGIVIKVIDNNTKTCFTKNCAQYNNVILIYHDDGSFSEYAHINTNGSLVKEGDRVTESQLIAKSGNIGMSSGPHLHFSVYLQRIEKKERIKTKFKVNDGADVLFLKEKETYIRNY